jgi:hypothetical protein
MAMKLRRYWFEFDITDPSHDPFLAWCGVTAWDLEDARRLLSERVFGTASLPPIRRVIEDIDISSLDANHVRPNMGVCTVRGVWFPLGFA